MIRFRNTYRAMALIVLSALAAAALAAGGASKGPSLPDGDELLAAGFKVLVATTKVQEEWVRTLPPGRIRPMQRTGKKYFVFPDAPRKAIYVGGPQEYAAYLLAHPEVQKQGAQEAANMAYRAKQADVMRDATARDLSNPFLGATWADLGW